MDKITLFDLGKITKPNNLNNQRKIGIPQTTYLTLHKGISHKKTARTEIIKRKPLSFVSLVKMTGS